MTWWERWLIAPAAWLTYQSVAWLHVAGMIVFMPLGVAHYLADRLENRLWRAYRRTPDLIDDEAWAMAPPDQEPTSE